MKSIRICEKVSESSLLKSQIIYKCEKCDYNTTRKHDLHKHFKSKRCARKPDTKSIRKTRKCENEVKENIENMVVNFCKCCHYSTPIKSNFKKHLLSKKHQNNIIVYNMIDTSNNSIGLTSPDDNDNDIQNSNCEYDNNTNTNTNTGFSNDLMKQFISLMKENQKETIELKKQLVELANKPNIKIDNHYTEKHITNNNQKMNIIQFLNHECKDAMNLSDFINNLVVTFDDLEKIEKNGYITGIKDTLIKSLQEMEKDKRPIHCTDIKRKQFYIKDHNTWEKDDEQYSKISKAMSQYNNKQFYTMQSWKQSNPFWKDDDIIQYKMNKITNEVTSGYNENNIIDKKLLQHISNVTKL